MPRWLWIMRTNCHAAAIITLASTGNSVCKSRPLSPSISLVVFTRDLRRGSALCISWRQDFTTGKREPCRRYFAASVSLADMLAETYIVRTVCFDISAQSIYKKAGKVNGHLLSRVSGNRVFKPRHVIRWDFTRVGHFVRDFTTCSHFGFTQMADPPKISPSASTQNATSS